MKSQTQTAALVLISFLSLTGSSALAWSTHHPKPETRLEKLAKGIEIELMDKFVANDRVESQPITHWNGWKPTFILNTPEIKCYTAKGPMYRDQDCRDLPNCMLRFRVGEGDHYAQPAYVISAGTRLKLISKYLREGNWIQFNFDTNYRQSAEEAPADAWMVCRDVANFAQFEQILGKSLKVLH